MFKYVNSSAHHEREVFNVTYFPNSTAINAI